uniref:Uncharacterized protein n=1 Tax=Magnetococcus massalia (strain MO-1) TaxID=451514 RepID=A0A1S7LHK3_MAGMO|nr:conserved protein of unknown function [Candidatus Magnetococcus massalia]
MKVSKIWFQEKRLVPQVKGEIDAQAKQKLQSLKQEITEMLQAQRFVTFTKQRYFHYDNKLNCLWLVYQFKGRPDEMFRYISKLRVYAFNHWDVPDIDALRSITMEPLFMTHPLLKDATALSSTASPDGVGYLTVTMGHPGRSSSTQDVQTIVPIHRVNQRDVFSFIVANSLVPVGIEGIEDKLKELYKLTMSLSPKTQNGKSAPPSMRALERSLLEADYIRARLPVLEPSTLTDMGKGMWELCQTEKPPGKGWVDVDLETPWEARNPEQDVRDGVVAIDFGTSSTVVACRENGKTTLLRVGMSDFLQKPVPKDYQNPTVLSFHNLPKLLEAWNSESYQPLTSWDDFHFSHQALEELRENQADQQTVASILTGIKQWPLRAQQNEELRIVDQQTGTELIAQPGSSPMPVPQQHITVGEEDPMDPIELYAYYLGLFINHRANGLFLEYYMTFPITYPKEIKQRILSAFARGLQRSLPMPLVSTPSMRRFIVREEASEPAAYAACALSELNIECAEKGTAFAVFDFGGGSTDFDFGLYRTPTEDEELQGYESVIRHFGASGDMYLGGENLVSHLAYRTFIQNLDVCRSHKIPFSKPVEADLFPGHEMFVDSSHVAQTNTSLVMAAVRHYWEDFTWFVDPDSLSQTLPGGSEGEQRRRRHTDLVGDAISMAITSSDFDVDPNSHSTQPDKRIEKLTLELLNRDREKVKVTLQIDRNQLNHYLVHRVGKGILRFFIALRRAFESMNEHPEEVHILQAGNSCRSPLVQALFTVFLQKKMYGWEPPPNGMRKNPILEQIQNHVAFMRYVVHRPPMGDVNNPYKPTAKTGVAIGLLKLIPGEPMLALGPTDENAQGEAPFRLFVGAIRRNFFVPILKQNSPYYEYRELGIPTRGVFNMIFSTSPQAGLGTLQRGAVELKEHSLRFHPGLEGKRLFIQAVAPYKVEICLADSLAQILKRPEEVAYQEILELK